MVQVQTIDAMNVKTIEVYEKNIEKLQKIKEEVNLTSDYCKLLMKY